MKAVIFDFDGVVVDSERHWQILGDEQFYPSVVPGWTKADGEKTMGLGAQTTHAMLTTQYGLMMPYAEFDALRKQYVDRIYDSLAEPLPGIPALLERLARMNVPVAIASSGKLPWISCALNRLRLSAYFPIICSEEDVGERTKPHPDLFLLAAGRIGVDPSQCIVLEDSTNGIRAAKAAGMTCIAIRTDTNTKQDLSDADRIIAHMDELDEQALCGL